MNLVERIKGILLQPKSEWPAIEREPGDAGYLFPNYVAIVAAIPAVCTFIGTSIIGYGGYRIGIGLGLVRVFVVAYIIDFLAGTFGAQKTPRTP
jgi:Yip1 domain